MQAWSKAPYAGGEKIADLQLREVYRERLKDMPVGDLSREGVDCQSIREFADTLFDGNLEKTTWVIRFSLVS